MPGRFRRILADRRFQQASDGLLALALLAASLGELVAGADEWAGPRAVEVAIALLCSLPIAFRRSRPVEVAILVAAAGLASGIAVAPTQGGFEPFVALMVAFYSLGVHTTARRGLVTLAVFVFAGLTAWLALVASRDGVSWGDWAPVLVWTTAAWGVGRVIRNRNVRTTELERLTVELQAERDTRAREAVLVERARIARELHDVIAHNVSVMSVQASAAGRILQGHQPEVRRALDAIETTGRETVDEMRRMLGILRRSEDELALAPQPSLRDLGALVDQVRAAGLNVDARIEGEPLPLPAGLDLSAYRIVQEALTNALKHAALAHVEVLVRYTSNAVVLEIVDDGSGTAGGRGTGNGLVGMRERVALFGGELRAGKRPEGGWALHATLPVGVA